MSGPEVESADEDGEGAARPPRGRRLGRSWLPVAIAAAAAYGGLVLRPGAVEPQDGPKSPRPASE